MTQILALQELPAELRPGQPAPGLSTLSWSHCG
jgi:hypothetical protein